MPSAVPELIASGRRTYSFELFPPKTDAGTAALWRTVAELEELGPDFVSVTYGAGGSTRSRTVAMTRSLARASTHAAVGHLTCVGASRDELLGVISEYHEAGVNHILALRGDPPGGPSATWTPHPAGLNYAADLVRLIREAGDFTVGVAAFPDPHPALRSPEWDAQVLRLKQDAGAGFAITQFFFDPDAYEALVERSARAGVTIPIIPGLMPVTNLAQIERFAALSGAEFPAPLAARFRALEGDADAVRRLGVEEATRLADRLLELGAPGLHFYTLNRSTATLDVFRSLGLNT